MTIDGIRHTKRADAGVHLLRFASNLLAEAPPGEVAQRDIGHLAGLGVTVEADRRIGDEVVLLVPIADLDLRLAASEVTQDPASAINRLERRIQGLDGKLEGARADLADALGEADRARGGLGVPFEHASRVDEARRRQREISELLTPADDEPGAAAAALARSRLDDLNLACPGPSAAGISR